MSDDYDYRILETEAELLRDFYQKWTAMHAIKTDELHMGKKQQAAQELWDQAEKIKNFYLPTIDKWWVK